MLKKNSLLIGTRVLTTALGVLVLRLLSKEMQADDYDIYIILKQILGWLMAIGFLGMATALPRTIVAHREAINPLSILAAGFLLLIPGLIVPLIIALTAPGIMSYVIFRTPEWASVILPFSVLAVSIGSLSLVALYFRGRFRFQTALTFELLGLGIVPLGIVLILSGPITVQKFLLIQALCVACLILLAAIPMQREGFKSGLPKVSLASIISSLKELLRFGIPKLLSGAYQMTLIGMFPIALNWSGADLTTTAAATLGVSLGITISAIAVTTNSLVTFNNIVESVRAGSEVSRHILSQVVRMAIVGGVIACLCAGLGTNLMVHYLIGPIYDDYALFINAGAVIGFMFLSVRLIEIPWDSLSPPWLKAKLGLSLLILTGIILMILHVLELLNPFLTIGIVGISVFCYVASLVWLLTHKYALCDILRMDQLWYLLAGTFAGLVYYFIKQNTPSLNLQLIYYIAFIFGICLIMFRIGLVRDLLLGHVVPERAPFKDA